jgi:hypothetical protein
MAAKITRPRRDGVTMLVELPDSAAATGTKSVAPRGSAGVPKKSRSNGKGNRRAIQGHAR